MPNPTIKEPNTQKDPSLHSYNGDGFTMAYKSLGNAEKPIVIWGHGWGQNHASFIPLAESLQALGRHIVLDFPGFGGSPVPFERIEDSWGSAAYADAIAEFIRAEFAGQRVIWIGHSFGCRVGTQLAAKHGDLIEKMVFIAGAGLKRRRSIWRRIIIRTKILAYKVGKALRRYSWFQSLVGDRAFGSTDYQNAGPMRGTLVQVVNEDLVTEARAITCPVLLLYGTQDTETPPETGARFKSLIKNAEMVHLDGQDHYTVLSEGRHPVAALIKRFITPTA